MKHFRSALIVLLVTMFLTQGFVIAQDEEEEPNPFEPVELVEIAEMLNEATADADPTQYSYAIVVNVLSPFWTAAAIG